MKTILEPGIAVLTSLRNERKFPLLSAVFLLPFVAAASTAYPALSRQVHEWIGLTLLLVMYSMISFYLQSRRGFVVCGAFIRRISEGDLTSEIDRSIGGQIGQMIQGLGQVNESLGRIVAQVRSSAESISTSAREITADHVDLSQRTQAQAATLEETAAGMEELASTAKRNADNCESATAFAKTANGIAEKGAETVRQAVERMALIDRSSQKIVDIIGTIDSIAFQTNILALNAAVEAARASEQGRGFAVVATEVRDLARRSAQAAKEIKALIQDSVSNIAEGTRLVANAGDIIQDIVKNAQKVNELFSEVANASKGQSSGVAQINQALTQLDDVTQQNVSLVDKTTAAMLAFEQETIKLQEVVRRFRISEAPHPRIPVVVDAHPRLLH